MRRVFGVFVVAACIAGAALAQDPPPTPGEPGTFNPSYELARDGSRLYPTRAVDRGKSGYADLCCVARSDRSLDCTVEREWPEHWGFGAASSRFARELRLTPSSYGELQTRQSQSFHLPLAWIIVPDETSFVGAYEQSRADAANLCGEGTGAPPNPIVVRAQVLRRF